MTPSKIVRRIAILGMGPSGLFVFKTLIESGHRGLTIGIFEKNLQFGAGMPYSPEGASDEHITNVSGNEIPELVTSVNDWIQTVDSETLERFRIDRARFHEYMVLPRLLFGQYLEAQFYLLVEKAKEAGIQVNVCFECRVNDVRDDPEGNVVVVRAEAEEEVFDHVIICTGHKWPKKHEGDIPGYFDSPYPPSKLPANLNDAVAIRGSSLTAIDAIRTLARNHGSFIQDNAGKLSYQVKDEAKGFKIRMHSRNGLLPGIRFHLTDSHLSNDSILTNRQIDRHIRDNDGFLSLDYIFEKDFKEPIKEKDPAFYELIRDMGMEEFVGKVMAMRERYEPFQLFRMEYTEAAASIKRHESVYWKEMLAVLSFAMNYPAKHFSAEDMQRLKKILMPLISVVIAFVPQSSCEEMLALHDAGLLELVSVEEGSDVEVDDKGQITYDSIRYKTFVDCVGQPHLSPDDFPFKTILEDGGISPALIRFRSTDTGSDAFKKGDKNVIRKNDAEYYLRVPGITVTDSFRIVNSAGISNPRIYMMAVPYMGGYNPDYSGLDFCEEAAKRITKDIFTSELK